MTDTSDRLTEIRARLDAATPAPWTRFGRSSSATDEDNWHLGHDVHGPPRAQRGQFERVADAELIAHAPADLAHLLSLAEQLQGQLDEFATLQDRIPDDENGDWGLGWDNGYNAALAEVRAMAAREPTQGRVSGPETPQGHPSEGTGAPGPHGAAQAADLTPAEQAAADALMDTIGSSLADTARAVVAAVRPHLATEPPVHDGVHHYLSTGCLHGDTTLPGGRTGHQYCQGMTGMAGMKRPATCKFCDAICRCSCHQTDTEGDPR